MTPTLLQDARDYPHAFRWNGALPVSSVDEWRRDGGWTVPSGLVELWVTHGGGELFESETMLQPGLAGAENIDEENDFLLSIGLPLDLLAFHRGVWISAIKQSSGQVVALHPESFQILARFARFEDWYVQLIRAEFAARYGLEDGAARTTDRSPPGR